MPPRLPAIALFTCCLLASAAASAARVQRVEITGLSDEAMQANVRSALTLEDELDKEITPRRLNYLLRMAERETREALEPFGYYSPVISIRRSDRDAPVETNAETGSDAPAEAASESTSATNSETATPAPSRNSEGRTLSVLIHVDPGQPVRVRGYRVEVQGDASADDLVQEALAAFVPRTGQVLEHAAYDASRNRVSKALAVHGYFDAQFEQRKVEVTRAEHAADIDLRWLSGTRHMLGDATFTQEPQAIIGERLLHKLVNWEPGEPYDEAKLERLRRSLVGLDYFGLIDVAPQPEQEKDGQVPVQVNLTPAPRSIYTTGLSYGTLSGAGVSLGMERRYLNKRGHKALAQLDYGQKRKALTMQYRVPAFAWLDGWYSASLQAADEQTDFMDTRRVEFVLSRSGQLNPRLNVIAALHVLRERWLFADAGSPDATYQFASFAFPALRAEYVDVDDRLAPRRGIGGTLMLRGGAGGDGFSERFGQIQASMQWFHGFDADSRMIVRGELGHTFADAVSALPPSLRFFAGGDRSIRGYGWREVGPRTRNANDEIFALGARNMVSASVEYERYFKGPWGAAVFVDSGSAFDGKTPDMHTGVGIGLRWRSPVGPVRIDIARGLKSPDSPFTLHLNIGADL
ncbi:MAG: autotransporter assembly complex family protein [Thermomonas sp.]|uniref:autotransporter assembly complex protein TamA n=1 Tax=Thermomonas sp. TaxID=1971895 RepID=UPI0039E29CD2